MTLFSDHKADHFKRQLEYTFPGFDLSCNLNFVLSGDFGLQKK